MKRIVFLTFLTISAVSLNAQLGGLIEDVAYTAETAVEGAADVAENAVYTAGDIATAPFRARHYDDRNGRYFYVTAGGGRQYLDDDTYVEIED